MIPIIRIEVETMRESMIHAFSEQLVRMDDQFKAAIGDACQPEKVQALLTASANRFMRDAIEEETKQFFQRGEGQKLVAKAVREQLEYAFDLNSETGP